MNDRKGNVGQLLPDVELLTLFGRFIRKSTLDKISQILDVINCAMSLMGTRPLLVEYLSLDTKNQF